MRFTLSSDPIALPKRQPLYCLLFIWLLSFNACSGIPRTIDRSTDTLAVELERRLALSPAAVASRARCPPRDRSVARSVAE
jgi:starvation-inducible outer membrane lipoprotein